MLAPLCLRPDNLADTGCFYLGPGFAFGVRWRRAQIVGKQAISALSVATVI